MKLLAINGYENITKGAVYVCSYSTNSEFAVIDDEGSISEVPATYFIFVDDTGNNLLYSDTANKSDELLSYMKAVFDKDIPACEKYLEELKLCALEELTYEDYVALPIRSERSGNIAPSTEYAITRRGIRLQHAIANFGGVLTDFDFNMQYAWNVFQSIKYKDAPVHDKSPEQEMAEKLLAVVPPALVADVQGSDIYKALSVAYQLLGG